MKIRRANKMQVLKAVLSSMFWNFCVLTTFLVVINSAFAFFLNRESVMYTWHMLRYPLIVFVSVLASLIYVFFEAPTRAGEILRAVLQMIITAALVFGMIYLFFGFGWGVFLRGAVIFIALSQISIVVNIARERKLANSINQRIKQFHQEE